MQLQYCGIAISEASVGFSVEGTNVHEFLLHLNTHPFPHTNHSINRHHRDPRALSDSVHLTHNDKAKQN